jgi:hypothetical protein
MEFIMYSNIYRILISVVVSLSAGLLTTTAQAHETHGKAQHGGVVAEGASFQAELVVKQTEVIIYLSDHGKELASKGVTGKLTVLADGKTYSLTLTPKTANQLQATLTAPVKTAKFVAQITVPGKPAASVRFELK